MSGRRLRHVNAEKKLEEWRAEAEERKLEKMAEDFMKKKTKDFVKSGKSKGGDSTEKYVAKYREDSAKCMEEVERSVRESVKGLMGSKRKNDGSDSASKRLKIWMGKRTMDDSDSEDLDEDDSDAEEKEENEKSVVIDNGNHSDSSKEADASSGSVTGGKPDLSSSEEEDTVAKESLKSDNPVIDSLDEISRSGAGNFGRSIARVAVAQVCQSIGFEGFDESALDALADIAIRYLCDLGKTSKFYANLAGRTECSVFDVVQGLEDLGMPLGFSGASEIHTDCIVSSGAVRELKEYVDTADEIPFAHPLPRFPVIKEMKMIPSFLQMGETPSSKHIPAWLPAFPDPHTYIQTPVWNERVSDPRADKIELARQHRKAERSLLSLQQRLVYNGSSMAATSAEPDEEINWLEDNKTENPFTSKPLQAGEKDMSPINLPAKLSAEKQAESRVSLLQTFAPAIEAMKDSLDSGSDGEKMPPKQRTSVFLEFKSGKKVFGEPLDLRIHNKAIGRTEAWFSREDEKDDKKRRVEFILRQSLENQQEPPQL